MYTGLQPYLRRPTLYERTGERFWDDPYISERMLAAHLDPDTDAASRRPEAITRAVEWILSLPLPAGAALLDLGCGPGLYTRQFSEHGLRVTGLDFSARSIQYARQHDPKTDYVLQDYLAMDYEAAFDIATLIYYDYGALVPEERRRLLGLVHRALKPGGVFLFDVRTPVDSRGKSDSTSWDRNPDGGFWNPDPHLCLNARYYYGETAEVSRTVVVDDRGPRPYNIWDCYFTRQSLLDETAPAGFSEGRFYRDVAGEPYSEDSPTICAVLQKDTPRPLRATAVSGQDASKVAWSAPRAIPVSLPSRPGSAPGNTGRRSQPAPTRFGPPPGRGTGPPSSGCP